MDDVKGIIFDFNGVLLWDSHLHEAAWRVYSKRIRGTEFSNDEMLHHVHGRTNKDILEYLVGRTVDGDELLGHIDGKESTYRQMCLDRPEEFKLSPGARDYLDYLKDGNTPRTIATASEIGNLRFFFEHLDLAWWFDFDKVVYDDGSIKGKPEPDIYLQAAKNIELEPAMCAVVEDSRSGIMSAHRAGIRHIVALGPKENHDELAKLEGVSQVIVDFSELVPLKSKNI